jgi:hypothetical protein
VAPGVATDVTGAYIHVFQGGFLRVSRNPVVWVSGIGWVAGNTGVAAKPLLEGLTGLLETPALLGITPHASGNTNTHFYKHPLPETGFQEPLGNPEPHFWNRGRCWKPISGSRGKFLTSVCSGGVLA